MRKEQKNLGYPYGYLDLLTPEDANKNQKQVIVDLIFIIVMIIIFLLGSHKSNGSFPTQSRTVNPIVQISSSIDRGGGLETSNLVDVARSKKNKSKSSSSFFIDGVKAVREFPDCSNHHYFDNVEKRIIKPSVRLQAHLTCLEEITTLPRDLTQKDKRVTFGKNFSDLFKKDHKDVFGYDLYLEENISKDSTKTEIKKAKQKLFQKYEKQSKAYLRVNLFENQSIIKSEKCQYCDASDLVKIYYNQFSDLFAVVNPKKNQLLYFDIATKVQFVEIFSYSSIGIVKPEVICLLPKKPVFSKSFKEYILSYDNAIAVLQRKYGSNFITVQNDEFQIYEWQAVKKLEHAVCFKIDVALYGFSQKKAVEINSSNGGLVAYVRRGKMLPSLDLIRVYLNTLKNFCEDRERSDRNDSSTFYNQPSITFFNRQTKQVVIFDKQTKIFKTGYKFSQRESIRYLKTGKIGRPPPKKSN